MATRPESRPDSEEKEAQMLIPDTNNDSNLEDS